MFGRKGEAGRETPAGEKIDTLIGSDCRIQGTLQARGSLRVDGQVEGEIVAGGDVFVGKGGLVTAGIKARNATVAGEVKGNVEAEGTLELLAGGHLEGDVVVGKLSVAPGANFDGACHMACGSQGEAPGWTSPPPTPAPTMES